MTKLTRKQRLDLLDYEREIEDQKRAEAEAEASEGLSFLQKRFRHQKDRVWIPSDAACDSPPRAGGADAADGAPPRLTGGDRKTEALIAPYQIDWSQFQNVEYFSHWLTDTKGRILEVPLRKGKSDSAMIDYLTFTFGIETVYSWFPNEIIGDNQIIEYLSLVVDQIFGFGVLCKLPGKGKFFYDGYYQLGPDNANYGQIHVGGQNDTVLIDLKGVGCMAAKQGWEVSLYHFLKHADRPRITRIDLACDFLNGEYTPNRAYEDHENGLFGNGNRRPKKDTRGSSWHKQDFSGMTLFIGSRGSAKYCRIYEKGRQLGDPDSPWVRFEVEFRKADSVLPLDMLIKPGQYLTGAYPIGETLFQNKAERVETAKRMVNINFDKLERHARQQVGRMMNFMLDLGIKPDQICERLKADDGKYPKGLNPEEYSYNGVTVKYMHQIGQGHQNDEYGILEDTSFNQPIDFEDIPNEL